MLDLQRLLLEVEDGREGKVDGPDVLRLRKELRAKRSTLLTEGISSSRHPLTTQDISSHRDDIATYIKVSDELEQVPAPLTRPVYLTPLSLKGLASFPAHPSTTLNEILPSTPPSQVAPSTPTTDDVPALLSLLAPPTDVVMSPLTRRDDDPLPEVTTRTDLLSLPTPRDGAPLSPLTPQSGVIDPPLHFSSTGKYVVSPSLSTSCFDDAAASAPPGDAVLPPTSTFRNNDGVFSSLPTPSNGVTPLPSDTRMHWEDVIGRINAPPPSRGVLGRQHSLDIGDMGSSSDGGDDGDNVTDGEFVSSAGGSGKESEDDEEGVIAATAAAAGAAAAAASLGRIDHRIDINNAGGVGCIAPFYDPPWTFDIADELLDPPSGSVHQRGLPNSEDGRPFSWTRGILRGTSFQHSEYIGLDDSHVPYGGVLGGDPLKGGFDEYSRDGSSGLDSAAPAVSGCDGDGRGLGVHRVSMPSTPTLVSSGSTGQAKLDVRLVREVRVGGFHYGVHAHTTQTKTVTFRKELLSTWIAGKTFVCGIRFSRLLCFVFYCCPLATYFGGVSGAVLPGPGKPLELQPIHSPPRRTTPHPPPHLHPQAFLSCLFHSLRQFQECDFEGHCLPSSSTASTFVGGQYQVVITGLESVGHAPQDLDTTAHFSVDSSYKVGRRASPIRVSQLAFVRLFVRVCSAIFRV